MAQSKRAWVAEHLGNPDVWDVDADGTILDNVRPSGERVVGYVIRRAGVATIRWRVSGKISEVPDWADDEA